MCICVFVNLRSMTGCPKRAFSLSLSASSLEHVGFLSGDSGRRVCSLLLLLVIVLQEEVVTGHSESSNQNDELCKIYLSIIVGIQVSHNLLHSFLILGILHVSRYKKKQCLFCTHNLHLHLLFLSMNMCFLTPR